MSQSYYDPNTRQWVFALEAMLTTGVQLELLACGFTPSEVEQLRDHMRNKRVGDFYQHVVYRPEARSRGARVFGDKKLACKMTVRRAPAVKIWDSKDGWCRPFPIVESKS